MSKLISSHSISLSNLCLVSRFFILHILQILIQYESESNRALLVLKAGPNNVGR